MKKTIITIMAILSVMTLASCEKGKPEVTVTSTVIEEMRIPEKTIEEDIIEETMIYTYVELEGESFTNVKMTKSEMEGLMNAYNDGKVSKEYAQELLYNAQT